MIKNIIICDLDGTLADIQHRRHFVERPKGVKKDWDAFHAACVDDTPMQTTIDLVHALKASRYNNKLWITSGRMSTVMTETQAWLLNKGVCYDRIIMRNAGDFTPDNELKKSWMDSGVIPKERIFCVFDDRDRVVNMWRKEGLICYQVAQGNF